MVKGLIVTDTILHSQRGAVDEHLRGRYLSRDAIQRCVQQPSKLEILAHVIDSHVPCSNGCIQNGRPC